MAKPDLYDLTGTIEALFSGAGSPEAAPGLLAGDWAVGAQLAPERTPVHAQAAVKPDRPAAVLMPIVTRPDPTMLLTVRAAHLNHHAGQVAFPGGRVEPDDADAVAAALRETHEEIGVPPEAVRVAGLLDPYRTVTGFNVTPVVGFLPPDVPLSLDVQEVAETFEVPLSFLMNPDNHRRESLEWKGRTRHYFAMPYEGYHIWGATAAMLVNLCRYLEADRALPGRTGGRAACASSS